MLTGVKAVDLKLEVILFGTGTEAIEAQQQFGVACCPALIEQFLAVLGIACLLASTTNAKNLNLVAELESALAKSFCALSFRVKKNSG